jgi:hypothetical protein
MRQINSISNLTHSDVFSAIIQSKREPYLSILNSVKNIVDKGYEKFENHLIESDLFYITSENITTEQKDALIHCYTSKTKKFNEYISQIKSSQDSFFKEYCPYCCIFNATTIDHYLPKEDFPEYSVHINNLIPCCDDCNRKKLTYWKDENSRGILYFYKDTLPQERYLYCDFSYNNSIPIVKYHLNFPATVNPEVQQIFFKHFERLNILNKYRDNSNVAITEHIFLLKNARNIPKNNVMNLLNLTIQDYKSKFGENYWKAVLFDSMINCSDLIEEIFGVNN